MTLRKIVGFTTLAIVLSTACALAQGEATAGQGGQSGTSQASSSGASDQGMQAIEDNQSQAATPDARSFQGTEEFSPGHSGSMRSYLLPSLSITEMADSNSQITSGRQLYEATSTIVGRLTFGKITRHTTISGDYYGGAMLYTHRSTPNSVMQQFGISGTYTGRRWSLTLNDRASYLPESGFGFGGFGYTGGIGMGLGGAYSSNIGELNPVFNPIGSLLTVRSKRIMNTSVVQVQYATSSRTSISIGGSYSILHFRSPGFHNTTSTSIVTSLSHALNARDYVGLSYGFSQYQLQSSVPAFQTHFVQASYGHKISGRMAMEVGGGPLIQKFTTPLAGPSTQTSWMATSSLSYLANKGNLNLSYNHFTTGGGGVLYGAQADSVRANWGMPLFRKWQFSVGPGFAHNRSLQQTTLGSSASKYNSFYGSTSISRSLGRNISVFLTYNYQAQRSEAVPCLSTNCENSSARHLIGFGFNFHPRQITFD